MTFGGSWVRSRPIALIIYTTQALLIYSQPPPSLISPQLTARAQQAVTLEPYTGIGAV